MTGNEADVRKCEEIFDKLLSVGQVEQVKWRKNNSENKNIYEILRDDGP